MQPHTEVAPADQFSTEMAGLPACRRSEIVDLSQGATFELEIAAVAKQLGDATVRMLAYNGSIPGPTPRVVEGSEVEVNVVNHGDLETTVHWHGLRLENRYDGTHQTRRRSRSGTALPHASRSRTNPGLWMAHCHIAEHHESGMMFSFDVTA
jgi:FtsP/CotA-like multicopper oxidase with cupredoxin domain